MRARSHSVFRTAGRDDRHRRGRRDDPVLERVPEGVDAEEERLVRAQPHRLNPLVSPPPHSPHAPLFTSRFFASVPISVFVVGLVCAALWDGIACPSYLAYILLGAFSRRFAPCCHQHRLYFGDVGDGAW